MSEFTSEVLPSGIKITVTAVGKYMLEDSQGEFGYISKQDIARMYGIAFPAKRHPGTCCINAASPEVDDINVADLQPEQECNNTNQKLQEALQQLTEKEALLKTAFEIMIRNMALNPDQHAASDMYHFVNNELEFLANAQPIKTTGGYANNMKTGIELITEERQKQISKGYTVEHDKQANTGSSLEMAAVGTLLGNPGDFPADWNIEYIERICEGDKIDRIRIAAALLVAELDRLNAQ